jgi:hypothetical protein
MQPHFSTLSEHESKIYSHMSSNLKASSTNTYERRGYCGSLLKSFFPVEDGDKFFKSEPRCLWVPQLSRKTFSEFARFVEAFDLKDNIKSVVLWTDRAHVLYREWKRDPFFIGHYVPVSVDPRVETNLANSVAKGWLLLPRQRL